MKEDNPIMIIKDQYSICGGAISVVGELLINEIEEGQSISFISSKSTQFYATIIEIRVKGMHQKKAHKGDIVDISIQDFGMNIITKGMKIYKA